MVPHIGVILIPGVALDEFWVLPGHDLKLYDLIMLC
jgi:hypothetical protein